MSIHAERRQAVRHPGTGRLPALIAALASIAVFVALASTAVLVPALLDAFDGASADRGALRSGESGAGAATRPAATRIGVRGVPLPATQPRGRANPAPQLATKPYPRQ